LHHRRQDGGDPAPGIAAILAAVMQSEFYSIAIIGSSYLKDNRSP
jgi:hypothetical protein